MHTQPSITSILQRLDGGDDAARPELIARTYDELRAIAARHMQQAFPGGGPDPTLQPTALVNETFMRLIRQRKTYDNRGQFFAVATRLIVRTLLDYHRERKALKRGGGRVRVSWAAAEQVADPRAAEAVDICSLTDALEKLEKLDSRKAEIVQFRVLWGLSIDEIAESLGASPTAVAHDWAFARAWLKNELTKSEP